MTYTYAIPLSNLLEMKVKKISAYSATILSLTPKGSTLSQYKHAQVSNHYLLVCKFGVIGALAGHPALGFVSRLLEQDLKSGV